ncbi:MAG: twin-arginine translocase TatA/TatE family subunit [Nitrospinae bacterium]|nr:twin-arginine translocase TatA/TatE family subunit [Nitrospinota bacterium]
MFGIGAPEMALIAVLALIFIGPAKLPEVARTLGRTYKEFQKALDGLKEEIAAPAREAKLHMEKSLEEDEIRKIKAEIMEAKTTVETFKRKPLDAITPEEAKPDAHRSGQLN